MDGRLTITEVAKHLGVTPRTIMRWEKSGKIKRSKRDWRGWRFYQKDDLDSIKRFYESTYEYYEAGKTTADLAKSALVSLLILALSASLPIIYSPDVYAAVQGAITETNTSVDINLSKLQAINMPPIVVSEAVKYTLGPEDVIQIDVRRHPEFSGKYAVNSEGKIEYKYIGDIIVDGLTKVQVAERLREILAEYIIEPEVDVQILAYLSKVFYVVGEVRTPGKFYLKGDKITVREALIQAGLPTDAAAMRRCRLITPNNIGKNNYVDVNIYKLLYEGDLTCNLEIKTGDVLYVPATAIAKIIRVISPLTNAARDTAGAVAPAVAAVML